MACGKDNTPRITQQVEQITKTLMPATPQLQALSGFAGSCVTFSDLDKRNPRTLIVDLTHARLGHYNTRTKRFYEVITKGVWTTAPFTVDPEDPKGQAIGKHTAIYLAGFISSRTSEHIENLINSDYFDDFTVNHLTGNVNDDANLEATTEAQNNYHGKVLRKVAELFTDSSLAYYPSDAKRNGKKVKRAALKYPLSIKEVKYIYQSLDANYLLPEPTSQTPTGYEKYEKQVIALIAEQIAQVWEDAHHYIPSYPPETYPLHGELKYLHQRRAVLSAVEAQKQIRAEEYHADYCFYRYEEQINKSSAEGIKIPA